MDESIKFSIRPKQGEIDFEGKKNHIRTVSLKLKNFAWGEFYIFDDDVPSDSIEKGILYFNHANIKLPRNFQNVTYEIEKTTDNQGNITSVKIINYDTFNLSEHDQKLDMLLNLNPNKPLFGDLDNHNCKLAGIQSQGGTSCPIPPAYNKNEKLKLFFFKGTFRLDNKKKSKELDHFILPLLLQDTSVVFLAIAKDKISKIEEYLTDYHKFKQSTNPNKSFFIAVDSEHYWDDNLEVYFAFEEEGTIAVMNI